MWDFLVGKVNEIFRGFTTALEQIIRQLELLN